MKKISIAAMLGLAAKAASPIPRLLRANTMARPR